MLNALQRFLDLSERPTWREVAEDIGSILGILAGVAVLVLGYIALGGKI